MNETRISGTIRDAFEPFDKLIFFDLSNNTLTGPIPSSLFEIPTIEIVYLFGNQMTGTIPSTFGNASLLRDLYINDNLLSGTVPSILPDQLTMLTEFRLESNEIVGTMPSSICALRGEDQMTDLFTLTADCDGSPPQIECDCCTGCRV